MTANVFSLTSCSIHIKHFHVIVSFNPHNKNIAIMLISPFYMGKKLELNNLPKVTQRNVIELGFEFRQSVSRAHALNHYVIFL